MNREIREILKKLLDNEYLIINYNEFETGFDLSIRLDEEKIKREQGMCEQK